MSDATDPGRGYIPPEEKTERDVEDTDTGKITEKIHDTRYSDIMDGMVKRLLDGFDGEEQELEELREKTKMALADFVSEFVDIEMDHQAELESSHLNPMTGVLNKRGAERIFNLLKLEQPRKEGEGKMVSVRLDLDNFKKVNDLGDHALGDAVLKKVAEELRSADILIHFSGDEFGLILFNVKKWSTEDGEEPSYDKAIKIALSRIIKKIENGCQEVINADIKKKEKKGVNESELAGIRDLKVTASVGYKILDQDKDGDVAFSNIDSLADIAASFSKDLKGLNLPANDRIMSADKDRKEVMKELGVTEAVLAASNFMNETGRAVSSAKTKVSPEAQQQIDEKMEEIKRIIEQNFSINPKLDV